ncbi:hypothetical protein EMWEY_00009900 [Eimeria maxima]|uniref:Uncharacterized protein n=1 Tax=Eimeria maxima TaxID=5804 RepID=U6ME46_EIMMA|nr:hypothetical protein EMWEY_00009900 [Eimeria maxima]CDJ61328.1 hypothetical protein EMWEY_00009900 [Eimeria maxima]
MLRNASSCRSPQMAGDNQPSLEKEKSKSCSRWRRFACLFSSMGPRKPCKSPNGPCSQDDSQWCSCLRHLCSAENHQREKGKERSNGCPICEKSVRPRLKLGIFEDSAIERWYILWRADHIVGFYKETCHLNLLICALQCLFGIAKAYVTQCLFLAVERSDGQNAVHGEFLGLRMQMPSGRRTLSALWRPVLQFVLLSALVLPMKLMDRRGGKNAWKFQLLALGQAVTYSPRSSAQFRPWQYVERDCKLQVVPFCMQFKRKRWDYKIMAFFMLGRTLYALFVIMVARAFENVRRQLFASQVLPFLMYLSVLANSQRVQNLCAIRTERNHCGSQPAESSISAGDEGCLTAPSVIQQAYSPPSL